MSNLLSGQWKQYYQMPRLPETIERTLSCAAFRYYGFLCREMNVHSAVELRYSNAEIAQATRIKDHKTIAGARNELQTARLIECHKVPPGVYAHIMLNHCGDPIPAPEDRKGIRRYSPRDSTKARASSIKTVPLVPVSAQATLPRTVSMDCRVHGNTDHWEREGGYVCEKCHPDPNSFRPPTASEVGF
jgi:hypothetical protein